MSWSITGTGSKAALIKHIDSYFDPLIKASKDTSNQLEYEAAKLALHSLVDGAPTGFLLQIDSSGSASYDEYPWYGLKIELKLVVPTFED